MAESTKHRLALERYWRMRGSRSLERLHAELEAAGGAPTMRTLYEWSRRFHWQDRIAGLEREAKRADDQARVSAMKEMYDRQGKEALLLQQKGAEWLATMAAGDATPEAAIRAVVEGARLERLARGEPTDRKEVQGEIEINTRLTGISDEELDYLIEYTRRALAGEGEAEPQ